METVKLGEIASFSQGLQVPIGEQETSCPSDDYVRFIRIVDYTEDTADIRYIKRPEPRFFVTEDDLVMIRYGSASMGMVGRGKKGVIANNMFKISPDEHRVHRLYLFYCLQSEAIQKVIWLANASSTMPALTFTIAADLDIPLPALRFQRRIAEVLSAYDELIKNSQRRIKVLEGMARKIYDECMQEGGSQFSTTSILDVPFWKFVTNNVAPYKGTKRYYATADVGRLAIEGAGTDCTFEEKPSRAQKQPTAFSVWFARMKDTYKIAWYSDANSQSAESSILSSGFAGFQAVEPPYFPLLFLTISSKDFHAQKDLFCTGATQMSLTNEGLARIKMPVPNEDAAKRLGKRTLPLLNQILVLQMQIQNLRRTRDLLLPRLLSGQVELETEAA